jgi:hypothetical protein
MSCVSQAWLISSTDDIQWNLKKGNQCANPQFRWQERARLDETYDVRYDNKAESSSGDPIGPTKGLCMSGILTHSHWFLQGWELYLPWCHASVQFSPFMNPVLDWFL